eukprot:11296463-Ditylum_brightwellii.AAC.1
MIFQIKDSRGEIKCIELQNALYTPDAPKNLISISQWSEERRGNCGVLSRGVYSIFMCEKDTHQKLVPHPMSCRTLMMQIPE